VFGFFFGLGFLAPSSFLFCLVLLPLLCLSAFCLPAWFGWFALSLLGLSCLLLLLGLWLGLGWFAPPAWSWLVCCSAWSLLVAWSQLLCSSCSVLVVVAPLA